MPAMSSRIRLGRALFAVGFSIFALSSSFSISLTEGGLLLSWLGALMTLGDAGRSRRLIFLDYMVLSFLAWELLTALLSNYRSISLAAYRSEWLVLTYFLVSFAVESSLRLQRILKMLALAAAVVAIYGIVQHFTGVDYIKHKTVHTWDGTYKAMGLLGHHITFGIFYSWVFSVSLAFLVFIGKDLRSRLLWTAVTCLCALAVLYSYSRAAWIGCFASLTAIAVLKRFRLGYLVLVVIVVVAVAVAFEPGAVRRAVGFTGGEPASKGDATRVLLLRTSLRMIESYPVFGIGPGTFTAEFNNFKVPGEYSTTCHAHNDYVSYAVHTGITGLAILIILLVAALAGAVRLYWLTTDRIVRTCLLAMVAGLTAILASGLFQCNLTDSEIGIQAWLIIGSIGMFLRNRHRRSIPEP
jgi:putative inorganic carbon (HCO3(-)) transporter